MEECTCDQREHHKTPVAGSVPAAVDDRIIEELVARAQADGLQLTGEGGLLQQLMKRLLESALEGEMTDHLGYDRHDPAGKNGGNSRNGKQSKRVVTDVGPIPIEVPRERDEQLRAADRQEAPAPSDRRRRHGPVAVDGCLTHGEISSHLAEVYGTEISKQTTFTITDSVTEGMTDRQARPLDRVYPVVFID
ncbi:transposase [Streptomyces sp. 1222.5]|uniref:transposase n=1 Tax=Streptomyces sp. 1222.5 TaxID=1881026 RepID=UPI003EB97B0C